MPFICAIDLYPKTGEGRDVADTDLLRNKDRRLEVGNAWLKIRMAMAMAQNSDAKGITGLTIFNLFNLSG